jgi:serine/threonine protein kinase
MEKHYVFEKKLGQGGQGSVYRAKRKSDGALVAVKILSTETPDKAKYVKREINVMHEMGKVRRDLFSKLTHVCQLGTDFYLEMEMAKGDLTTYMNERLTVDDKYTIALDIVEGLITLHENGIVHGDLKTDNVLYYVDDKRTRSRSSGQGYRFKLADFGLSCNSPCVDYGGTKGYLDPAVACFNKKRTPASDMYAFGVVLYNIFAGAVYAMGTFCAEVALDLYHDKRGTRNDSLWTLIFNLLQPFSPEDRLTAVEAREMLRTRKGIAVWTDQTAALAKLQAAASAKPSTSVVAACARSRSQSKNFSGAFLEHVKEAKVAHYELCSSEYTLQDLRKDLILVFRPEYVDKNIKALDKQISSILRAGSVA